MEVLQARIDSFQKPKRVKRYPTKPSSSSASIKWPHPPSFRANPNTLAEAGFFFSPSWDDRDSVACFLCGKELSDWDADDDPFEIHYTKCQNSCAWAVVRCGLYEDIDDDGSFLFDKTRLPSSKVMEKARLETFGRERWPHDDERGHCATSTKMAQAGFVYTPQAAGDDTVTCLYCNMSLGGWEKEDDPIREHRTRDGKSGNACPFLALSAKPTRSKPAHHSAPQKKPPQDTAAQQSDDELAVVEVAEPPPPRAKRGRARSTTATASSKSRRKTRATRGKSAKPSAPPARHSPSPHEPDDPSPPPSRHSPSPSRTTAPQELEDAPDTSPMDIDDAPLEIIPEPEPIARPPSPPRRDSHQDDGSMPADGPTPSLRDRPEIPPAPSPPPKSDTSPPPSATMNNPDPIISLSPTGRPTVTNAKVLTDDERAMTLEQWIRHEINVSYDRLMTDGKRQIELFQTKATELRRCIDEL